MRKFAIFNHRVADKYIIFAVKIEIISHIVQRICIFTRVTNVSANWEVICLFSVIATPCHLVIVLGNTMMIAYHNSKNFAIGDCKKKRTCDRKTTGDCRNAIRNREKATWIGGEDATTKSLLLRESHRKTWKSSGDLVTKNCPNGKVMKNSGSCKCENQNQYLSRISMRLTQQTPTCVLRSWLSIPCVPSKTFFADSPSPQSNMFTVTAECSNWQNLGKYICSARIAYATEQIRIMDIPF